MQRNAKSVSRDDKQDLDAANGSTADVKTSQEVPAQTPSNLVFGYLNLFSDGVVCFSRCLNSSILRSISFLVFYYFPVRMIELRYNPVLGDC